MLPQLQASVQIHNKMYKYTHTHQDKRFWWFNYHNLWKYLVSIFIIALKTFSNVVSLFSSPSTDIYSTSSSIRQTVQELVIQSHSKTNTTTDPLLTTTALIIYFHLTNLLATSENRPSVALHFKASVHKLLTWQIFGRLHNHVHKLIPTTLSEKASQHNIINLP